MIKKCPVCSSDKNHIVERMNNYSLLLCEECGLEFADPLTYDIQMYKKAYEGEAFSEMGNFYPFHMELIQQELSKKSLEPTPPLYLFLLKWAKKNLKPKSVILDIGCGAGHFLALLKNEGFIALGLDIAPQPIKILREHGFTVTLGSVDDYPAEWPRPDAIVLLEVLEHLDSPRVFLKKIHNHFPGTPLILSTPSPKRLRLKYNRREEWDYPPHHITRWSEEALSYVLKSVGYNTVQILHLPVYPNEISLGFIDKLGYRLLTGKEYVRDNKLELNKPIKDSMIIKMIKCFRLIICKIVALYFTWQGYTSDSMVGVGIARR